MDWWYLLTRQEFLACLAVYLAYCAYWVVGLRSMRRAARAEGLDAGEGKGARGRDALLIVGAAYFFGVLAVLTGVFLKKGTETLATISGTWITASMILGIWSIHKSRAAALAGEAIRPARLALRLAAMPMVLTPVMGTVLIAYMAAY